jgi:hypothetical protein
MEQEGGQLTSQFNQLLVEVQVLKDQKQID